MNKLLMLALVLCAIFACSYAEHKIQTTHHKYNVDFGHKASGHFDNGYKQHDHHGNGYGSVKGYGEGYAFSNVKGDSVHHEKIQQHHHY